MRDSQGSILGPGADMEWGDGEGVVEVEDSGMEAERGLTTCAGCRFLETRGNLAKNCNPLKTRSCLPPSLPHSLCARVCLHACPHENA
jgi:hypothetical protein